MNTAEPHATSLEVEALDVWRVSHARERRQVLHDVSFTVQPGECVALVGANGAGKSSLLFTLVGALPFEGSIRIGGRPLEPASIAELCRQVGLVFEDPREQLFMPSVREEVAFGPVQQGLKDPAVADRVQRALNAVDLSDHAEARPSALSLGQQRRLAVATVLAQQPALILLDEPTAGLDPLARRAMIDVIAGAPGTRLWATHDLDAAVDLDARVLVLCDGHLVADGRAAELLCDEALLARARLALPLAVAALRRHSDPERRG